MTTGVLPRIDRQFFIDWYRKNRERTRMLFDLVSPEAYYTRPIPLRHPIVFYEGHLPAFSVNTLLKRGLGRPGIDSALEALFARGIDPADELAAQTRSIGRWPSREAVEDYVRTADEAIVRALEEAELDVPGHPVMENAEGVFTLLEHEAMHQETLLYIFHQLPVHQKRRPPTANAAPPSKVDPFGVERTIRIARGRARVGAIRGSIPFGWDNEFDQVLVDLPAFSIDRFNVTNHEFREFVEVGGYRRPDLWSPVSWRWREEHAVEHPPFWSRRDGAWFWRGMFDETPLNETAPVYVTHAEAEAFARWKGKRLPSEAEYARAAYGTTGEEDRPFPWGDERPAARHGNFDFQHWDPVPVGSYPEGRSAWGVDDLVGNGWEWTSTVFGPLPGFRPMPSYPEYSADFFDNEHYVIKGASSATARELVRPSFRNWFRPHYPYVYTTFRCATS